MQTKSVITQKPGMIVTTDVRAGYFRDCGPGQVGSLCTNKNGQVVSSPLKRGTIKDLLPAFDGMAGEGLPSDDMPATD